MRVVATLTTLPGRYEILTETIESLKNQTYKLDAIYLAVPKRAARLDLTYQELPDHIVRDCKIIHPPMDYGPVTKIYGGIYAESDPNTVIISFDDDVRYPPNFVEVMMKYHHQNPNVAICGTGALVGRGVLGISIISNLDEFRSLSRMGGFNVPRYGRPVDIIYGVGGVLFVRKFFPKNEDLVDKIFKYAQKNRAIFLNDDVLISGYLCKNGIKRVLYHDIPSVTCLENKSGNALSKDFFKSFMTFKESIRECLKYGLFPTMEPVGAQETAFGKILIVFLFVIGMVAGFYGLIIKE